MLLVFFLIIISFLFFVCHLFRVEILQSSSLSFGWFYARTGLLKINPPEVTQAAVMRTLSTNQNKPRDPAFADPDPRTRTYANEPSQRGLPVHTQVWSWNVRVSLDLLPLFRNLAATYCYYLSLFLHLFTFNMPPPSCLQLFILLLFLSLLGNVFRLLFRRNYCQFR